MIFEFLIRKRFYLDGLLESLLRDGDDSGLNRLALRRFGQQSCATSGHVDTRAGRRD